MLKKRTWEETIAILRAIYRDGFDAGYQHRATCEGNLEYIDHREATRMRPTLRPVEINVFIDGYCDGVNDNRSRLAFEMPSATDSLFLP